MVQPAIPAHGTGGTHLHSITAACCTESMLQLRPTVFAPPGFILYCLDLVYRLAQWMNTSAVTGSLVTEDLLTLQLSFDSVQLAPCFLHTMQAMDASSSLE